MKKLTILMLALVELGLVGVAQAGVIYFNPTMQTVASGDNVSFDVNVDFSATPTIGGYFQISYDASLLGFVSFTYNSGFGTTYTPTVSSGLIDGLGFASSPYSGIATLGTVVFSTADAGLANLAAGPYSNPTYNFRNSTGSSFISMTYGSASAEVTAVPVPAALWLMASGLSALGVGLRRRSV